MAAENTKYFPALWMRLGFYWAINSFNHLSRSWHFLTETLDSFGEVYNGKVKHQPLLLKLVPACPKSVQNHLTFLCIWYFERGPNCLGCSSWAFSPRWQSEQLELRTCGPTKSRVGENSLNGLTPASGLYKPVNTWRATKWMHGHACSWGLRGFEALRSKQELQARSLQMLRRIVFTTQVHLRSASGDGFLQQDCRRSPFQGICLKRCMYEVFFVSNCRSQKTVRLIDRKQDWKLDDLRREVSDKLTIR